MQYRDLEREFYGLPKRGERGLVIIADLPQQNFRNPMPGDQWGNWTLTNDNMLALTEIDGSAYIVDLDESHEPILLALSKVNTWCSEEELRSLIEALCDCKIKGNLL